MSNLKKQVVFLTTVDACRSFVQDISWGISHSLNQNPINWISLGFVFVSHYMHFVYLSVFPMHTNLSTVNSFVAWEFISNVFNKFHFENCTCVLFIFAAAFCHILIRWLCSFYVSVYNLHYLLQRGTHVLR